MSKTKPVIVIAAGGTGGHIFPAIATGEMLKELFPEVTVVYACGERPLEVGLYEQNGISPVIFPAKQLRRGLVGKIQGVYAAAANILRAWSWLRKIEADLVVGFGGYVAGPTVLAGKFAGCKTAIHEANSIPGKTNRILGRWMDITATHFEDTLNQLGGHRKLAVGMPIRALTSKTEQSEARAVFGLQPDIETLLIMGGSQGARFLYESIMDSLAELDAELKMPLQILWSTGESNYNLLSEKIKSHNFQHISIKLVPFITDMGNALKAADIAVARAGASALAELLSFRVYTIYVPFPAAIYDHQTLNAMEAQRHGAGVVLPETEVRSRLVSEIKKAFSSDSSFEQIRLPEYLDSRKAAETFAGHLYQLATS